ncbi:hypothetical protein [Anaeromyxobacter sp. PSR-1]|uniref:hypothetical protein n=1 Tax=Anaeromyxobacter sp. PSR-1 TaxID=1300915 RepID=UPI001ED98B06|nr:hypothetical protein [Anaeromyxobacter sp. PSR-1]
MRSASATARTTAGRTFGIRQPGRSWYRKPSAGFASTTSAPASARLRVMAAVTPDCGP